MAGMFDEAKPHEQQQQDIARLRKLFTKLSVGLGEGRLPIGITLSPDFSGDALNLIHEGLMWRVYWHILLDDGAAFDGASFDEIRRVVNGALVDL